MVCDTATLITHSRIGSLISHRKLECIGKTADVIYLLTPQPQRQCKHVSSFTIDINDFHQEFFALIHIQHKMERVFFTLACLWFKEEVRTPCWCPMIL